MKPMVDGWKPFQRAAHGDQRALQAVAAEQDPGGEQKRYQGTDGGHDRIKNGAEAADSSIG